MADASQQVKEWGRHVVPPRRDVGAALAALSEEDLLRLRAIARLRARSRPRDRTAARAGCRRLCQAEGDLPLAEPQFPHRNLTAPHQSVTAA